MLDEKIIKKLAQRTNSQLHRKPPEISGRDGKYIIFNDKKALNFASNDYLGIGSSAEFRKIVADNFSKYGTSSSSSRLVSGNYSAIIEAEKAYAEYFGYRDALFFPSGYQANIGILSALLPGSGPVIFDKHVHASCVRGIELSGAHFMGYNHNSMAHLEKRLKVSASPGAAVVTESLFSMDGDFIDVEELKKLKDKYNFFCIVDEAHSFGAAGHKGRGIARRAADVAVGTFGKAFGFFGAFALLPDGHKEYLFNFSSPLIYTTALPEAHAASALELLRIIESFDERRDNLREISGIMKQGLLNAGFSAKGQAHIIALEIGKEEEAVNLSKLLLDDGFFVMCARYPTVPAGKAIIRISLTAVHTEEDVKNFLNSIKKTKKSI